MKQPERPAWATFIGPIDQVTVARIANSCNAAVSDKHTHLHMMFQSSGGVVSDGIALFELFQAPPIRLSVYCVGTVASVAAIAFVGAHDRIASEHATFMLHRTRVQPVMGNAEHMSTTAHSVRMDDLRTEEILRGHTRLNEKQLRIIHGVSDLWLNAKEAVDCGLVHRIGKFRPERGAPLTNVSVF